MAIHYKDFKVIRTYLIKKSNESNISICLHTKTLIAEAFKVEELKNEQTNDSINIQHYIIDNNVYLNIILESKEEYEIVFTHTGNIDCLKISKPISYNSYYRETGPACIYYTKTGDIESVEYYLDVYVGNTYTEYKNFIFKNKNKYPYLYQKILKKDALNIFD